MKESVILIVAILTFLIISNLNYGSTLDINLADERFVKGKYYYFNENTTSFFLDRMDNGFD